MRMFGKSKPSWCPVCRCTAGPDCPDRGKTKRQVKREENHAWRREYADDELYPELEADDA